MSRVPDAPSAKRTSKPANACRSVSNTMRLIAERSASSNDSAPSFHDAANTTPTLTGDRRHDATDSARIDAATNAPSDQYDTAAPHGASTVAAAALSSLWRRS